MREVTITPVENKRELMSFINFPHLLYKDQANYIGELNLTVKNRLTRKNPFLKHGELALFIAKDPSSGAIVGRIAAIHNRKHLEIYQDECGFFGYFDVIDDADVAAALFNKVIDWQRKKGIRHLIGPTNLTTNDSCGLLTKGFEFQNQVNMPYNYKYYHDLLATQGFEKEMTLYAYCLDEPPDFSSYENVMGRIKGRLKSNGILIRSISPKSYKKDIQRLRIAYNQFNQGNWGFLPLDEDEFQAMAKDLKAIMPYDLALIAEIDQNIIGFVIAVPDFNQAVRYIRNGKLFPLGIFKILKHRKSINSARVMLIGIDPKFRGSGLDLVLYQEITQALLRRNITSCEASYVMASNDTMNSLMLKMGAVARKEYALYKKSI